MEKKVAVYVSLAILLGVATMLFLFALCSSALIKSVEKPNYFGFPDQIAFPSSLMYVVLMLVLSLVFALGAFLYFKRKVAQSFGASII